MNLKKVKKEAKEYFENLKRIAKIKNNQLVRFHEKHSFEFNRIVELILTKYNSKEYINNWYSRGIEPPNSLLFFLFDYAKKYGRDCSDEEYEEYSNIFSVGLFYVHGWYFTMMNGQGTVIKAMKSKVQERKDKLKNLNNGN